jgi:hypothetical protein
MIVPKTLDDINSLIINKVEENKYLDYKGADSLRKVKQKNGNNKDNTKEISKDVSAFANSAGGVIIYGILEYQEKEKSHLPEKIDPINRLEFSKEQLEHKINGNVSPNISGLEIHPIIIDEHNAIYVVEIPQSNTAHQNSADNRYYMRYNFESVPMEDYQIKDIINRQKHPIIDLEFKIYFQKYYTRPIIGNFGNNNYTLIDTKKIEITLVNKGTLRAENIDYEVTIPTLLLEQKQGILNSNEYTTFNGENTTRDETIDGLGLPKYGPKRIVPLIRGKNLFVRNIILNNDYNKNNDFEIEWTVFVDNAEPLKKRMKLKDIEVVIQDETAGHE